MDTYIHFEGKTPNIWGFYEVKGMPYVFHLSTSDCPVLEKFDMGTA
jgi:hypothetical protein